MNAILKRQVDRLNQILPGLFKHLHIFDPQKLYGIEVTFQQYFLMDILLSRGKCMMSELSQSLGVALSAVTSLVDKLIEKKYVHRERDLNDRRVVWISLTDLGREITRTLNLRKRRQLEKALKKLAVHEREKLVSLLEKLTNLLGEKK